MGGGRVGLEVWGSRTSVTTTLEGLKSEPGVPPADLELSLPISTRTLERIACDCTMSRVLLADSVVTDLAGLRPAGQLVERASHRVLGQRWHDQPAQPPVALLLPSSPRP